MSDLHVALSRERPSSSAQFARVETHRMPVVARDARAVCADIKLEWVEALRLYRDGLISFNPATAGLLDESQEAELTFVGSLVVVGGARLPLRVFLRDLHKPYCYDVRRVFFDWADKRWRLLPAEDDPESTLFAVLDRLELRSETEELLNLRDWLNDALDVAHERESLFTHEEFCRAAT